MTPKLVRLNQNLLVYLDAFEEDSNKNKRKYVNTTFSASELDSILKQCYMELGGIVPSVIEELYSRLNPNTVFVEASHQELADSLGVTRGYVTQAIKKILNYRVPLIIKVSSGIYCINPKYRWRCSLDLRHSILLIIEEYGYNALLETLEAKIKADLLYDILKKKG